MHSNTSIIILLLGCTHDNIMCQNLEIKKHYTTVQKYVLSSVVETITYVDIHTIAAKKTLTLGFHCTEKKDTKMALNNTKWRQNNHNYPQLRVIAIDRVSSNWCGRRKLVQ